MADIEEEKKEEDCFSYSFFEFCVVEAHEQYVRDNRLSSVVSILAWLRSQNSDQGSEELKTRQVQEHTEDQGSSGLGCWVETLLHSTFNKYV